MSSASRALESIVNPQVKEIIRPFCRAQEPGRRTRFAPSPTGYLHLGHVAAALYVWGIGRASKAQIQLRIEDHDLGRSRSAYEEAILEDLNWLGWQADVGVSKADEASDFRQSNRHERYQQILTRLEQKKLIYRCTCSRRSIASAMNSSDELRYLGQCRHRKLQATKDFGVRLILPSVTYRFRDLFLGLQTQTPAHQCGDLLLVDRDQNFTYHFSSVVDDLDHGINLLIRGQDLTSCCARQVQLAKILGQRHRAQFVHHPLIMDTAGKKLSKRDLATSIRQERQDGLSREEIIGKAAWLGGIVSEPRPLSLEDVERIFYG